MTFCKKHTGLFMKKAIIYIALFISGVIIGFFIFYGTDSFKSKQTGESPSLLALKPIENNKDEFIKSAFAMLGNSIIVKGQILEVYKNQYNETVVYIKDFQIPITVTCGIYDSENQIKEPFRIGEVINLQGKFTELGDEMHLDDCRIIDREER
jgi:hypothetical protein